MLPLKWFVYRSGIVTVAIWPLKVVAERADLAIVSGEFYAHLLWRSFYEGVFAARRERARPVAGPTGQRAADAQPLTAAKRVLLVSNGVGEDLIAGALARDLASRGVAVTAFPLVGLGAYPADVPLLDPRRELHSGGFSFRAGLRGLQGDLAGGILGLWSAQRRTLRAQRGRFDLVVAIGDTYCLYMAGAASRRVTLVATADSVRIGSFGNVARWWLRRFADRVFTRDADTADTLAAMGCQTESVGTAMLDQLQCTGETFGLDPTTPVVTLLPGSRRDAPDNAALLADAATAVAQEIPETRFLMALAPSVSADLVRARVAAAKASIVLTPLLADAVSRASVVMGLAGTANEQAAGLGKPVVAFPGNGAQFGPHFLKAQHRLLGEALLPTATWRAAATAVVGLLRDHEERRRRGQIGRQRMGLPGATQRILTRLLEILSILPDDSTVVVQRPSSVTRGPIQNA